MAVAEDRAVVIVPVQENQENTPLIDDLEKVELRINPELVKEDLTSQLTITDIKNDSERMNSEEYLKSLENKVIVPLGNYSTHRLDALGDFSSEDLNKFIGKKQKILNGLNRLLLFFRVLKPAKINKVLGETNDFLYDNANVLARSNAHTRNLSYGFSMGFGLNDWVLSKVKKIPGLEGLPKNSGFYLYTSFGLTVGFRKDEEGRRRFIVEPTIEYRHATEIYSPFAILALGPVYSPRIEYRGEESPLIEDFSFIKTSILTFTESKNLASISVPFGVPPVGMTFIPGGGAAAGMKGSGTTFVLNRSLLPKAWSIVTDYLFKAKNGCNLF
ncbi:MAG: hypothetical protein A4S09_13905 [Proteobacteria bacterium SG_bin7]|nr:MAG: hypothetical protein A4S09_13905 [Proteobacteria bacterium SG_bin7]